MKVYCTVALALVAVIAIATSCSGNQLTSVFNKGLGDYFPPGLVRELAHKAAAGDVTGMEALVAKGVNIDMVGRSGVTPLIWAVGANNLAGTEALLRLGANPNRSFETSSSPLVLSIDIGSVELFELLLKYKADPNWAEPRVRSAISRAILGSETRFLKLSLEYGGNPNLNPDVNNLLENAITLQHFNKVNMLLEAGADPVLASDRAKKVITEIMVTSYWAFSRDPEYNLSLETLRNLGLEIRIAPDAPTKKE